MGRTAALAVMVAILVWWPVDLLTLERTDAAQATFTSWRLACLAIFAGLYVALRWVPVAGRFPVTTCAPFSIAATTNMGYWIGELGGLEEPFFYMLGATMFFPIVAAVSLPIRGLFMLGISTGLCVGFFGLHPEHMDSPLFEESLSYLATTVIGSTVIGHLGYIGFCHRFFLRLEIERAAQRIAHINETLEERVAAKTADVRRLAEHVQAVQEAERGRLSRELHDELGQRLSAMRYVLANVRQRFSRNPSQIGPNLDELEMMVAGALDSTRHIVGGLRPAVLEQLGLRAAIDWLLASFQQATGIAVQVDATVDEDCESQYAASVAIAGFRVVQEALTNIGRHSGATCIRVSMNFGCDWIVIELIDNGRGFGDAEQMFYPTSHGLLGMRERAEALGGELEVGNAEEGGACVRVRIPVIFGSDGEES